MPRIPALRPLTSLILTAALATLAVAQTAATDELDVVRCWAIASEAPVSQTAADGGRFYAGSDGARLSAFSMDGKETWSAEFGGRIVSNILVGEQSLFVATNSSGEPAASVLRIVSRDTGIVAGIVPLPAADAHFISRSNGSMVVVSSSGVVQLMDDKGAVKWRREIAKGFAGVPVFGTERLYIASTTQQIFTIRIATGEIESVRKVTFPVTAVAVGQTGGLLVGDERGNLTSLTSEGRTNWRFRSGARITRIFNSNDSILALSNDNFVYCIDLSNGGVNWKRRLGGRAAHSLTINGTYALTTSIDEHGAVLTGLANGRPVGQITFAADEFVTTDPAAMGGLVLIGTNIAVYGYSLSGQAGCPK